MNIEKLLSIVIISQAMTRPNIKLPSTWSAKGSQVPGQQRGPKYLVSKGLPSIWSAKGSEVPGQQRAPKYLVSKGLRNTW